MDKKKTRIAIYGIYKNEEKFIKRFLHSVKDADEVVLCDTGSTDSTNEIIKSFCKENSTLRISIYKICVSPWRFDDARNTALSLISSDIEICISLDIDEYLMDGWKECLLKHYDPTITRYFHKFSTIWPNGGASQHWHERIHKRIGYQWKLPVHEILEYNGEEKIKRLSDFWIYQKPDTEKSRSSYLPLLEQSVKERNDVWKSWSFLAGEYIRARKYDKAIWATDEALKIEDSDKGYLHKLKYIIYKSQNKIDLALHELNQAIMFLPIRREIRFEKAKYLHQLGRNLEAFFTLKEAEKLNRKITDYHFNESAWNEHFVQWKEKLLELAKKEGLEL
ncbi:glycosyltransferase [Fredinandcohnia sp. 179-A 10B2 NHS]|uniref:glycosyltransferase n=1 Tax=Fredinandcohnia sp. 179-A 10B2 NHS TaxID=3235176 RepID=UPI00399FC7AA